MGKRALLLFAVVCVSVGCLIGIQSAFANRKPCEPVVIEKEVIKYVDRVVYVDRPVEVVKEVVKEVPVEKIVEKEVRVEVPVEVVKYKTKVVVKYKTKIKRVVKIKRVPKYDPRCKKKVWPVAG